MKIKITEGQLERIKSRINEGVDNQYNREVLVTFNTYNVKYKGHEINDISPITLRLYYTIEIEGRSWGIKDISLSNITGPSDIEIELEYYVDSDNTKTITLPMKLNWETVFKDQINGLRGIITIDDKVEVELVNDSEGNLVVKEIRVDVYTL
jgi:hypothetical protein